MGELSDARGPAHSSTVASMLHFAQLLWAHGRASEAEAHLAGALSACERALGLRAEETLAVCELLGELQLHALDDARRAVSTLSRVYQARAGAGRLEAARVLAGALERGSGNGGRARELRREVYKGMVAAHGRQHALAHAAAAEYASALLGIGGGEAEAEAGALFDVQLQGDSAGTAGSVAEACGVSAAQGALQRALAAASGWGGGGVEQAGAALQAAGWRVQQAVRAAGWVGRAVPCWLCIESGRLFLGPDVEE